MLLYNYKKEFIGIDEKELQVLGYSSFSQLRAEVDDFADLFIKEPGFIHNFKHVNWIDFVECADSEENAKVIISVNSKKLQCYMSVETIYLSDEPSAKAFCVHLNNIRQLTNNEAEYVSVNLLEQSQPEPIVSQAKPIERETTTFDSVVPLDLDFKDTTEPIDDMPIDLEIPDSMSEEKTSKAPQENLTVTTEVYDNGYVFDPLVASAALGLPVDLIEEFIEDFIAQAKEFKEEIYTALADDDKDKLKILSHKLKGVAANLRIEDALESLTVVNTSENTNDIQVELDLFYKIISKLSGEEVQVISKAETITPPEEPASLDIFTQPVAEEPIPLEIDPVEKIEEAITLDFDDEIEIDFKEETLDLAPQKNEDLQEAITLDLDDEIEITASETTPTEEFDFIPEIDELPIKDIPLEITIPELADDDFLPLEEDVSPKVETFAAPVPIVTYSKQNIAYEIGIDQASFDELFQDYITEAQDLSNSIAMAIETGDSNKWKHFAVKLKGMSDNMRIKDCTKDLEIIINSQEPSVAKSACTKVTQYLTQLSKIKE